MSNRISDILDAADILKEMGLEQNDDYWCVYGDNEIGCFEFTFTDFDIKNILDGNCFKTEAEAKGE